MRRFLSLLVCTALLLGLGLFAAPSGSALAAPAAKAPAYGSWREAYTAMLTDESARAAVIGRDADYRRSYFSGDPSLLTPSAYSVADLNADGAPELLLYAEGTGLTDVFSFDGALRYLGYDAFFGFLPEEGTAPLRARTGRSPAKTPRPRRAMKSCSTAACAPASGSRTSPSSRWTTSPASSPPAI